jgi:hypothetical protein
MKTKFLVTAVALASLAIISPASASSLLTNGGFDDVPISAISGLTGPYINLSYAYPAGPGGPGTVGDWTYTDASTGGGGGLVQFPLQGNVYFQGPAPLSGSEYAFLQDAGSISQTFNSLSAGATAVSWYEAGRQNNGGVENYEVLLNNVVLGTYTTSQSQPFILETLVGTLVAGSNTLEFLGLTTNPPDETAFIENVSVSSAPLPSTWTMLIAGFVGLLGFVAFGGKKRKVAATAAA